jgi:hypothetical protein
MNSTNRPLNNDSVRRFNAAISFGLRSIEDSKGALYGQKSGTKYTKPNGTFQLLPFEIILRVLRILEVL